MTGFRSSFPQGEEALRAYLAELERLENARDAIELEDDGVNYWCGDCNCIEGEIHMDGCDMERCPWCGGQLISCECSHSLLGLEGDQDLTKRQMRRFERLLEKKGRVPFILWPNLCGRCGTRWPKLRRSKVSEVEWDRYVQIDERKVWLCEPCYARIKKVIDERFDL